MLIIYSQKADHLDKDYSENKIYNEKNIYFCKKGKLTTGSIVWCHGVWRNMGLRLNHCLATFQVYDHGWVPIQQVVVLDLFSSYTLSEEIVGPFSPERIVCIPFPTFCNKWSPSLDLTKILLIPILFCITVNCMCFNALFPVKHLFATYELVIVWGTCIHCRTTGQYQYQ